MNSLLVPDSFNEECDFGVERTEIHIAPANRAQPEVCKRRTLPPASLQAHGRFALDNGDAKIKTILDD